MILDVIQLRDGKGVCFPSSIIDSFGINDRIIMETRQNEIVITTTQRIAPRKNWSEAFQKMNQNGDDKLFITNDSANFEWEWQ
jgi:antitoxin MazE